MPHRDTTGVTGDRNHATKTNSMSKEIKIGYYAVKFYNHAAKYIMYFNGSNFEGFRSERLPDDEIEKYTLFSTELL
jgi:hypothetical protein